jgi:hypothetical protein
MQPPLLPLLRVECTNSKTLRGLHQQSPFLLYARDFYGNNA